MRVLPAGLREHLDSGTTTLCHCWRLTTPSGEVMGFTDHDRSLAFDGVDFEAEAGFTATEIESATGFRVDNLEASGALSSTRLNETRILAGDFDNAAVEVWLVNWQDVSQRLLLRRGNLGEVTHGSLGFTAELRGLVHALNQPQGRIYQYGCDARLGDSRCAVDLEEPAYKAVVTVLSMEENRRFTVSGAEAFEDGWFARGTAEFSSGANVGRNGQIKFHRDLASGTLIELWQPPPFAVLAGVQIVLRAGCNKQFETCKAKFANGLNFRGFPHIPGDDFVLSYATRSDGDNDGESRN